MNENLCGVRAADLLPAPENYCHFVRNCSNTPRGQPLLGHGSIMADSDDESSVASEDWHHEFDDYHSQAAADIYKICLLYTSPSPRD